MAKRPVSTPVAGAQLEVGLKDLAVRERCVVKAGTAPVLTLVEEAVVKVLPQWPEAYRAVMDYVRSRAGGVVL